LKKRVAFKIVDDVKNSQAINEVFTFAYANNYPVEACFYKDNPQFLLDLFAKYPIKNPSLHTNHYNFDIGSIVEKPEQRYDFLDLLTKDLEFAKQIGAKLVIVHPYRFPFAKKKIAQRRAIEMFCNELSGISEVLRSYGIVAHIENTFDEASFYRLLFEEIKARNITNFGFCFDIGHAKVWSSGAISEWMRLLYDIDNMGFAIHSHIHANDGLFDEHMPFFDEILSNYVSDDEFLDGSYIEMIKKLHDTFPNATFTAEVKPQYALRNMEILSQIWLK
jgi:sugar phosphate isomerase/epimerase